MLICVCLSRRKREALVLPYINSLFKKKYTFDEDKLFQKNAKIQCLFLLCSRGDYWPSLCQILQSSQAVIPILQMQKLKVQKITLFKKWNLGSDQFDIKDLSCCLCIHTSCSGRLMIFGLISALIMSFGILHFQYG